MRYFRALHMILGEGYCDPSKGFRAVWLRSFNLLDLFSLIGDLQGFQHSSSNQWRGSLRVLQDDSFHEAPSGLWRPSRSRALHVSVLGLPGGHARHTSSCRSLVVFSRDISDILQTQRPSPWVTALSIQPQRRELKARCASDRRQRVPCALVSRRRWRQCLTLWQWAQAAWGEGQG